MSVAPSLSRRTLVRGTAWSAPAILASSVVPAYAASRCQARTISFDASWGTIVDLSGSHNTANNAKKTYIIASNDQYSGNSWRSHSDTQYGSGLTYAEYSISREIEVVAPGQPITMVIPFSTGLANNAATTSMEQRVTVLIDDVEMDKVTTRSTAYDPAQYYPSNEGSASTPTTIEQRADGYTTIPQRKTTNRTITFTPSGSSFTITFKFWKAVNTSTSRIGSTASPYDATKTQVMGNDKVYIAPLSLSC